MKITPHASLIAAQAALQDASRVAARSQVRHNFANEIEKTGQRNFTERVDEQTRANRRPQGPEILKNRHQATQNRQKTAEEALRADNRLLLREAPNPDRRLQFQEPGQIVDILV